MGRAGVGAGHKAALLEAAHLRLSVIAFHFTGPPHTCSAQPTATTASPLLYPSMLPRSRRG